VDVELTLVRDDLEAVDGLARALGVVCHRAGGHDEEGACCLTETEAAWVDVDDADREGGSGIGPMGSTANALAALMWEVVTALGVQAVPFAPFCPHVLCEAVSDTSPA